MRGLRAILVAGMLGWGAAAGHAVEPGAPDRLPTYDDAIASHVANAVRAMPQASLKARRSDKQAAEQAKAIAEFYAARENRPIWLDRDGLGPRARKVATEIARADDYGLDAAKFELPTADQGKELSDRAADEIALTKAVLDYAVHARGGRIDPRALSEFLDRGGYLIPPAQVLAAVAASSSPDAYLRGLHPQHEEFEILRQRYLALRAAKNDPKKVRLPKGPKLSLGSTHSHVALLRKRLGVAPPAGNGPRATVDLAFDEELLEAVKRFQKDQGLSVDGIVGRGTRKALNGDGVDRTKRLLVNMERWRWMPDDLGEFYIWTNIPEFKFRVMKNGKVIHAERIVVGKVANQTPTFSDEMEEIVFNPRWNVPNSIKQNELLPGLRRSPSSLTRNGFKVRYGGREINPASVNWRTADISKYHIYQPPGRANALGTMKFLFPNKHIVYMHDTPSKNLFNKRVRTFSHGCVRVRNPLKLAEIILANDQGMAPRTIKRLIDSGRRNSVFLKKKIPVHLTYFTARVNAKGEIYYLRDPYGHDRRISLALAGKPLPYVSAHPVKPQRRKIAKVNKKPKDLPFWALNILGLN